MGRGKDLYPGLTRKVWFVFPILLPDYVVREFDDYLKCGRLEHGFLRVRCDTCHHEKLVAFSCNRRGFCRGRAVHHTVRDEWWIVLPIWWKVLPKDSYDKGCPVFLWSLIKARRFTQRRRVA